MAASPESNPQSSQKIIVLDEAVSGVKKAEAWGTVINLLTTYRSKTEKPLKDIIQEACDSSLDFFPNAAAGKVQAFRTAKTQVIILNHEKLSNALMNAEALSRMWKPNSPPASPEQHNNPKNKYASLAYRTLSPLRKTVVDDTKVATTMLDVSNIPSPIKEWVTEPNPSCFLLLIIDRFVQKQTTIYATRLQRSKCKTYKSQVEEDKMIKRNPETGEIVVDFESIF